MNARTLTRSALALFAFAGIVACSAAPETIQTSSGELSLAPPTPPVPVWPAANRSAYCFSDMGCAVTQPVSYVGPRVVDPALLTSLGCTQSYGLTGVPEYPNGTTFAVCTDWPAVRDDLALLKISCDWCLPQLPAGEIYVDTSIPAKHKPNCPSGCPGGGTGSSSGGKIGGSTSSTK